MHVQLVPDWQLIRQGALTSFEWFSDKVVPGLVTGAVAGWVIPRALDTARGRRELKDKTADLLLEKLEETNKLARTYWVSAGLIPADEAEIEYRLGEIRALFVSFAPDLTVEITSEGTRVLADLIDAVTGGLFASAKRDAEPQRIAKTRQASLALIQLIVRQKRHWIGGKLKP